MRRFSQLDSIVAELSWEVHNFNSLRIHSAVFFFYPQDSAFLDAAVREREEELNRRTLEALLDMRIKFPGKTDEEAEVILESVSAGKILATATIANGYKIEGISHVGRATRAARTARASCIVHVHTLHVHGTCMHDICRKHLRALFLLHSLKQKEVWETTTAARMTTPHSTNLMIGWMRKNNRATRAARTSVHFCEVVCPF